MNNISATRYQIAQETARALCRRDGGPQFVVSGINRDGERKQFGQPSRFDADRFANELKTNFYTDVKVEAAA